MLYIWYLYFLKIRFCDIILQFLLIFLILIYTCLNYGSYCCHCIVVTDVRLFNLNMLITGMGIPISVIIMKNSIINHFLSGCVLIWVISFHKAWYFKHIHIYTMLAKGQKKFHLFSIKSFFSYFAIINKVIKTKIMCVTRVEEMMFKLSILKHSEDFKGSCHSVPVLLVLWHLTLNVYIRSEYQ